MYNEVMSSKMNVCRSEDSVYVTLNISCWRQCGIGPGWKKCGRTSKLF